MSLRESDLATAATLTVEKLNQLSPPNPLRSNRRYLGVSLDVVTTGGQSKLCPRFHGGLSPTLLEIIGSDPKVTRLILASGPNIVDGLTPEDAVRKIITCVDKALLPPVLTIQWDPYRHSGYNTQSREFFEIIH